MDTPIIAEEYLSPEYRESLAERARRHETHQSMLQSHKDQKQKRREAHRRDHGRSFVYPGHLY